MRAIIPEEVMKKSAHAHSALVYSRQFHGHIERKECSHFNEVGER